MTSNSYRLLSHGKLIQEVALRDIALSLVLLLELLQRLGGARCPLISLDLLLLRRSHTRLRQDVLVRVDLIA